MKVHKLKSMKVLRENSIPLKEFGKDFTKGEKQVVEDEKRYYKMVVGLRKARQAKGLTQEELARKAKLPRTTITKIESGSRNATLKTLMTLAGAMGKKLEIRLA